jgi:addiction module RelE/StbE family toxin
MLEKAKNDLDNIYQYISQQLKNKTAAKNLKIAFKKAFQQIRAFPESAEKYKEAYRKIPVKNYLIFYKIEETEIIIHKIRYGYTDYNHDPYFNFK